mmetsp:Transcript_10234/g.25716  ORF Transcript_10234/g.25716 Transcript_10234/m.25716 type:complete len:244 (-) Transcript_10234:298-1029(-)
MGSPEISASSIVPGPALVTIASLAFIHSSMFDTNPCTVTGIGQSTASRFFLIFSFFPHTTTTCAFGPSSGVPFVFASSSAFASFSINDVAVFSSPPTPSPPPTTSTLFLSASIPTFLLAAAFSPWVTAAPPPRPRSLDAQPVFGAAQNAGRTGSPMVLTAAAGTRALRAARASAGVGTMTRSAAGWNQVGWAAARSVTTVTKGGRAAPGQRLLRALRGRVWVRGWTETMMSGADFARKVSIFL